MKKDWLVKSLCCLFLTGFAGGVGSAQTTGSQGVANQQRTGSVIQGVVKDDTGGVIPGANVTLKSSDGKTRITSTGADGSYLLRGVVPGTYTLSATYSGLRQLTPLPLTVVAGQPATANLVMTVAEQKQEVTVTSTITNQVSTDPANNSSALVLQKEDLDALPDDPDDLQADLQALAGPSAGPGGNQIFVDGFTGGRLPPKESIREIRINSNPFSAEFDKLGYGRIQIFTKPGSDKFHGQGYYGISDSIWNSRNPFLSYNPSFRTQLFGGNVSGPLGKKASFFVDVERRNIDDNGIVNASIPLPDLSGSQPFQQAYATPQRRTTVSPRADIQLNANNTLSLRYSYLENDHQLAHIGAFNVPQVQVGGITLGSNGYSQSSTEHLLQLVETAVLSPRLVNETHFEFSRDDEATASSSLQPQLNVGQAFVAGGSGYTSAGFPKNYDNESSYELQNYTSVTWGAHVTKFGIRVRTTAVSDLSPQDFNGSYTFLGNGAADRSISQYLMTERLLEQGVTPQAVTATGYGPSKFTIDQGNPYLSFYQMDFGPFVQDDWRVRPNLTLSLGLRWESQTNINDKNDWAPRVGFAWSPGARGSGNSRPKTVIRGGWGYFYDRFASDNVAQAYRSNQVQQYTVSNPTFYNAAFSVPTLPLLTADTAQSYVIDKNLKAPRVMQTVIGVDRQLFSKTTLSVNFMNARGTHELITDDINAPIPITGELPPGFTTSATGNSAGNTLRPLPGFGDIYDYQSVGVFKQTQVLVSVNSQVGKRLTLFSRYAYSDAHSDTDGAGTMPANPYNIAQDWGRSSLDIHHSLFIGGSVTAPWGLRFSPFIVARSGTPYNITTGTDLYLQGAGQPTARPEVVGSSFVGAIATPFGYLNPSPVVGAPLIERNIATSPGFLGVNLRVSKTFGFGSTSFKGQVGGARAGGGGGGGGGRGGGGGFRGGFGNEYTEHRYNLVVSVNARNILNHENLNTPNGAISSPFFLQSTGIAGGFGPEQTASNQRRIDLQIRFAF